MSVNCNFSIQDSERSYHAVQMRQSLQLSCGILTNGTASSFETALRASSG